MRNKLAIVGLIEPECHDAPFDDEHYDIWTLNGGCQLFEDKRIDLLFDMHDWERSDYEPTYYEWLQRIGVHYPVMKPYATPKLPTCEVFPFDEALIYFGKTLRNSICYMVAFAALQSYQEVFVYGTNGSEFETNIDMLKSLYETIGRAKTFGVRVYFVCEQQPTIADMYGYSPFEWGSVKDTVPDKQKWHYRVKHEKPSGDTGKVEQSATAT